MRNAALILVFFCTALGGCAMLRRHGERHEIIQAGSVDSAKAEKKYTKAVALFDAGQRVAAEDMLREVLILNPNHGPARNTLGLLFYDQRKYYLASWEFEQANTLMPERPEPKNNLGLVLESVGKLPEATEYYQAAWMAEPHNPEYLGNFLRARVRLGEPIEMLRPDLEQLVLIDFRPEWVDWAKSLMAFDRNPIPQGVEGNSTAPGLPGGVHEVIGDVLPEPVENLPVLEPSESGGSMKLVPK